MQGRPDDHDEYVIYDKRRALIEYVIFYSTSSMHSSVNVKTAHEDPVDVTELREWHDRTFAHGEFVNSESRVSQHDADDRHSQSSTPVSGSGSPTSGRATPADSDSGTNDVLSVAYDPVTRMNVVRQRSKPVPTQSSSCKYRSVNLCVCVFALICKSGYTGDTTKFRF